MSPKFTKFGENCYDRGFDCGGRAVKVSITLPSIFPEALDRALANIRATTKGDYEIVVVSPFRVSAPDVVWVEEAERNGSAFAQTIAAKHASGDFITAASDDCDYLPAWDQRMMRIYDVRAPKDGRSFCLGLHYGLLGSVFGIYYANFPFMRREQALSIGYFDGNYKKGFTDSDLGLKVWSCGGRCEYSVEKLIEVTDADKRKGAEDCPADDLRYFVEKWGRRYGRGFDTSYMRAINVDFDPELNPEFVDDRTVFNNSPRFVSRMAMQAPPHLINSINGVNIVRYRGEFLTVPQGLGPLDLRTPEHRNKPGIKAYRTLAASRRAAESHGRQSWFGETMLRLKDRADALGSGIFG
jgi:hypothetical protein